MHLPVERILWAPTNSAHYNHLHVVGDPRMLQADLPTNGIWTPAIVTIVAALDAEFGEGDHYQAPGDHGWTHMGVYNPRYIAGTTVWSQHAGANAIDIGPYYGVSQQQKFYNFLTGKEEPVPDIDPEVLDFLNDMYRSAVIERGSNGTFAGYTVDHLRNHPKPAVGVTQDEFDNHRHNLGRTSKPV